MSVEFSQLLTSRIHPVDRSMSNSLYRQSSLFLKVPIESNKFSYRKGDTDTSPSSSSAPDFLIFQSAMKAKLLLQDLEGVLEVLDKVVSKENYFSLSNTTIKQVEQCFSVAFESVYILTKTGVQADSWSNLKKILLIASSKDIKLSSNSKLFVVKTMLLIINYSNRNTKQVMALKQEEIFNFLEYLFTAPLITDSKSIDGCIDVLLMAATNPLPEKISTTSSSSLSILTMYQLATFVLQVTVPYVNEIGHLKSTTGSSKSYILSNFAISQSIKAISIIVRNKVYPQSISSRQTSRSTMNYDIKSFNGSLILKFITLASITNQISIGLFITAIIACREIRDAHVAFELYLMSKRFVLQSELLAEQQKQHQLQRQVSERGQPGNASVLFDSSSPDNNAVFESTLSKTKKGGGHSGGGVATVSNFPSPRTSFTSTDSPIVIPSVLYGQAAVAVAQGGLEAQTYQICVDMCNTRNYPTAFTVNNVCLELSKYGAYRTIQNILLLLTRNTNIQISGISINALLNACDKSQEYNTIIDIYNSKKHLFATYFDSLAVSVIIKSCDRLGLPQVAVEVLEYSIDTNIPVTSSLLERVFAILVKAQDAKSGLSLLWELENQRIMRSSSASTRSSSASQDTSSPSTNSKIHGSTSSRGAGGTGLTSINSLKNLSLKPLHLKSEPEVTDRDTDSGDMPQGDNSTLLAMDTLLGRLLAIPETDPVPPSFQPYYSAVLTLLARSSSSSNISSRSYTTEAKALLYHYITRGGVETEDMYVNIIISCRSSKKVLEAEELYLKLKFRYNQLLQQKLLIQTSTVSTNNSLPISPRKVLTLTRATYNAILSVYLASATHCGYKDVILAEMKSQNLDWDEQTYAALMVEENDHNVLVGYWDDLTSKSIRPTKSCVKRLLESCVLEHRGRIAMQVLNYTLAIEKTGMNATTAGTTSSTSAIRRETGPVGYMSGTGPESIDSSATSEGTTGLSPPTSLLDLSMYEMVLLALKAEGLWTDSMTVLDKIIEQGLTPTKLCYAVVMSCLERASDWRRAISLLVQMTKRNAIVDVKILNMVLSACNRAGQYSTSWKIYEKRESIINGYNPSLLTNNTYNLVLYACCRGGFIDKVMPVLENAYSSSLLPSNSALSQVMALLEDCGCFGDTVRVFLRFMSQDCFSYENASFISMTSDGNDSNDYVMVTDLHGLTTTMARAAVRTALWRLYTEHYKQRITSNETIKSELAKDDETPKLSQSANYQRDLEAKQQRGLVVITGVGRNSKESVGPVLKSSIPVFLSQFDPPLLSVDHAGNPGR